MSARLTVIAVPVTALLAACSGGGSATSVPNGMPTTATALGALVRSGAADLTSARLRITLDLSAEQLAGAGEEELRGGEVSAVDLTANLVGAGAIRVVHVDGRTYAKLPPSMNPTGTPYLRVTADSSNPTIHELSPYLDAALTAVSPANLGKLAAVAQEVEVDGARTVNGMPVTHYALKVDATKLDPAFPGRAALSAGGKQLPLDLYIARDGRPAQADLRLTAQGQDVPIDVKFSGYNNPVSINAPPPGQIGG